MASLLLEEQQKPILVSEQPESGLRKLNAYESTNVKLVYVKNSILSIAINKFKNEMTVSTRKNFARTYNKLVNQFIHLIPELLFMDSNSGLLLNQEKVPKVREQKQKLDAIQGSIKPRDLDNEKIIRTVEYRKEYSIAENRNQMANPNICYLRFSRSKVSIFDCPEDLLDALQSFVNSDSSIKISFEKKVVWGSVKTPDNKILILDIKLSNIVIDKPKIKIESDNTMIVNALLRHEYYGPIRSPNSELLHDRIKFKHLLKYQNLIQNKIRTLVNEDKESKYVGFLCNNSDCSHSNSFLVCKAYQYGNRVVCNGILYDKKKCTNDFCYKCGKPYHGEYSLCSSNDDEKSEQEIKAITKKCPNPLCTYKISKDGGCNHMTCSKCGQHFCWTCLETFLPTEGWHAPNTSPCNLND